MLPILYALRQLCRSLVPAPNETQEKHDKPNQEKRQQTNPAQTKRGDLLQNFGNINGTKIFSM